MSSRRVPNSKPRYESDEEDEVDEDAAFIDEAELLNAEQEIILLDNEGAPEDDDDDEGGEGDLDLEDEDGEGDSMMDEEALAEAQALASRPLTGPLCDLIGHEDAVYAVATAAPKSPAHALTVCSGSGDDSVALWEVPMINETNNCSELNWTHVCSSLGDSIVDVAFSADGSLVAAACLDARITVLDAQSGVHVATLEGAAESVERIRWHPRGPVLLAGDGGGGAWLWSVKRGSGNGEGLGSATLMHSLFGHGDVLVGAEFTPDGKRVVTASADGTARVWDPVAGTAVHVLNSGPKWHRAALTALALHAPDPSRTLIATGCAQGTLCLTALSADKCHVVSSWTSPSNTSHKHSNNNAEEVEEEEEVDSEELAIESIAFVRGQPWVACASLDCSVRVYDLNSTQLRHNLKHQHGVTRVLTLSSQANAHLLVSATLGGDLILWDVRSGERVRQWAAHGSAVLDLALREDPQGQRAYAVTAADDGSLRVWDLLA